MGFLIPSTQETCFKNRLFKFDESYQNKRLLYKCFCQVVRKDVQYCTTGDRVMLNYKIYIKHIVRIIKDKTTIRQLYNVWNLERLLDIW
jgi:hypothetical protein